MFRAFRKYSPNAPYDGIPSNVRADKLPLDTISCAGKLCIAELRAAAVLTRRLNFARSLDLILHEEVFREAMIDEIKAEHFTVPDTAAKWKEHLKTLGDAGILQVMNKSCVRIFSRYFAVPKSDEQSARAILNLKQMSKLFKSPPPVNLPEINEILKHISSGGGWWIVADWRHYFHQFSLAKGLWPYFGVECGSDVRVWTTMAMGWSYSPRIAQTAAWSMILEACFRAKLLKVEDFQGLPNPPSYVKTDKIFIVVWYDNLLATFVDVRDRDSFDNKINEVCGPAPKGFNCEWKHYDKFNMQATTTQTKKLPVYLGMEFATRPKKQSRDREDREWEIIWRHEGSRIARWEDVSEPSPKWTPRQFARAVGVRLWDATISDRALCEETEVIDILRNVGVEARSRGRNGWDEPSNLTWTPETLTMLRSRVAEVRDQNIWRTLENHRNQQVIYAASDASGTYGYGGVMWNASGYAEAIVQGRWTEQTKEVAESHIYLKEYLAATLTVNAICKINKNRMIRLAVDNTAVVHSLRARYSSNRYGCEFIRRIQQSLVESGNQLEVVAVVSADNAADSTSRGKGIEPAVVKRCMEAFAGFERGLGLCGNQIEESPQFTGCERHGEPELEDLILDYSVIERLVKIPSEDGGSLQPEPITGADSRK